jgi:hypothetical protein
VVQVFIASCPSPPLRRALTAPRCRAAAGHRPPPASCCPPCQCLHRPRAPPSLLPLSADGRTGAGTPAPPPSAAQGLLGPRRPRPYKVWKKRFVKARGVRGGRSPRARARARP